MTNALGNATIYAYDLRGHKILEHGATYPVRYTYDIFGNKITMTTFRDERATGDTTTWLYDEASNCMTNKVYADGKGPTYSYTPDGKLSQRIWARGIVTDYSYDGWGNLTNTVYSDDTPTISLAYDALGRQTEAHDAAGITTFVYDDFGSITNETVIGVAGTTTIIRHWDSYGRSLGYSLVGLAVPSSEPQRQSTLAYDTATGRLVTMLANGSETPFAWSYLDGADRKSSLTYPNGLTASWQYDANNQLLQVCNATPTNVISQYDYTYDAAGRRVSCAKSGTAFRQDDTIAYGYNARSELTNATAAVDSDYRYAYDFDEIGNRETSSERGTNCTYAANSLNQYAMVGRVVSNAPQEEFIPQYDDDGNQTLIKTSSGVWLVQYNGDNRPVEWSDGETTITMKFDRIGRRVEYVEIIGRDDSASTNEHHRFVYDGYLCLQRLDAAADNAIDLIFSWDPTEAIATCPLMIEKPGKCMLHVTHDGNKNVSDLAFFSGGIGVAAHYEYTPFGLLTATTRSATSTGYDFCTYNPFRFSSEYADDALGLVYYNYRHYEPIMGSWLSRDPIEELGGLNLYENAGNDLINKKDRKGLSTSSIPSLHGRCQDVIDELKKDKDGLYAKYQRLLDERAASLRKEGKDASSCKVEVRCECCNGIRHLHTGGAYVPPNKGKTVGRAVICENALWNFRDADAYKSHAKEILHHEMLHAVQECYSEDFATPCEESICREINAHYKVNVLGSSFYRTESERRHGVWDGVRYSSSFTCFPSKAPNRLSEQDIKQMETIFNQLYEKCKNKWPRKSL